MKNLLLFVFVMLFSSCEKQEDEPLPISDLAIDLQNGYWEINFTSGAAMVLEFDVNKVTSHWLEEDPLCILQTSIQDYTLEDNRLTMGDDPSIGIVEIQGDVLSITWESDGWNGVFERKSTLNYQDCE